MTETKQRSELIHRILIILVIVLAVALFLEWRVVRNRWVEEELSVEPVTETLVVHSPDEIDWGREEAAEELDRIWQRLEHWFDRVAESEGISRGDSVGSPGVFEPDIDLVENEEEYVVSCDLPGVDKNKIDVEVRGNLLTVTGSREVLKEKVSGQRHYYRERRSGSFARTVILPGLVDQQGMRADYNDGILTIRLPKAKSPRQDPAKKVQVI